MTPTEVLSAVDALIEATPPAGRVVLVVQLAARVAAAAAGMAALPAGTNGHERQQTDDREQDAKEASLCLSRGA